MIEVCRGIHPVIFARVDFIPICISGLDFEIARLLQRSWRPDLADAESDHLVRLASTLESIDDVKSIGAIENAGCTGYKKI